MIIEHIPTPDGKDNKTDTDKLSDIEAMILEKAEELRKLCFDSNRQCVILVDAKGHADGKATHFWNFRTSATMDTNDEEAIKNAHINLLSIINAFILAMTNGQVCLARRDQQ